MAKRGKNPGRSSQGGRGSRIDRNTESGSQRGREQGGRGRQSSREGSDRESGSDMSDLGEMDNE